MIYNLPLRIPVRKEKSRARVITLPGINAMSFNLSIGSSKAYSHILSQTGLLAITVNDIAVVKKVLRERMLTNGLPGYIIFNLDQLSAIFKPFVDYVQSNTELSKIPLFVYKETATKSDKDKLIATGGIDGIITANTNFESFNSTLLFAQKVKQLAAKENAQQRTLATAGIKDGAAMVSYFAKRLFDILVSGTLLLVCSPIFLLIAVMIRIESKGAIFYISPRAGKRYQIFKFYKFRTMVADADKQVKDLSHLNQYDADDKNGPVFFKLTNDPRVTKFGAFLRNTSLDEIPQLINVLKGDMSLVGNRPLPLYEAATLTTDQYAQRFIAPAGITGLWQVKKRGKKDMSVDERIGLDIDYAKKHSFFYDMRILAYTPAALIQKENV
jgi:lipopolysaccharide/colanic/teichoic acid biosynthesis glycosyltransferase